MNTGPSGERKAEHPGLNGEGVGKGPEPFRREESLGQGNKGLSEIRNLLRIISAQSRQEVERLLSSVEPITGSFETDIVGPRPVRDSLSVLERVQEGIKLIDQAVSPGGLRLPNGDVFRVKLASQDVQPVQERGHQRSGGQLRGWGPLEDLYARPGGTD